MRPPRLLPLVHPAAGGATSSAVAQHLDLTRAREGGAPVPAPAAVPLSGYAGVSQVPKSNSFTFPFTNVMWKVEFTLSTVPEPCWMIWNLSVKVRTPVSCLALKLPPPHDAPRMLTTLPSPSTATTFRGVIVNVKFSLPEALSPSCSTIWIEPEVIVYVASSQTNWSPATGIVTRSAGPFPSADPEPRAIPSAPSAPTSMVRFLRMHSPPLAISAPARRPGRESGSHPRAGFGDLQARALRRTPPPAPGAANELATVSSALRWRPRTLRSLLLWTNRKRARRTRMSAAWSDEEEPANWSVGRKGNASGRSRLESRPSTLEPFFPGCRTAASIGG